MENKEAKYNYYKILEVSQYASQSEIEEAWKKKLREYDVNKLKYFGEKLRNLAEKETQLINEAYETLSDPEKRKTYNQTINGKRIERKNDMEQVRDFKLYAQRQADIHNNRAIQYWQEGQYERAITEWKKGIKIAPSAELYHNLATAYLNLRDYNKAIEIWEKTVKLYPDLVESYNNLGCAYHRIGEPELAAKNWKIALELSPDCEEARKNLDMLIANSIRSPDSDVLPYRVESNKDDNSKKGMLFRVFSKFKKKT